MAAYSKQTWATGSAVNATTLAHIEDGIGAAQTAADSAQTAITGLTADGVTDATVTGKALIRASSTTAARAAIGAGTSSLALGTTSTTAKAGDWFPGVADIVTSGTRTTTAHLTGGGWVEPANGGATTFTRPMHLTVASSDAPADFKAGADYICDGTNDTAQIQAALNRAAALQSLNPNSTAAAQQIGKVQLSGGRFNIRNQPIVHPTGVECEGQGFLTHVRPIALGSQSMWTSKGHLTRLGKMYLDGNSTTGGTGHCLDWDLTGVTSTADYPDINSDSNNAWYDLYVDNWTGTSTQRHGLYSHAASTANNRVNSCDRIFMRDVTGNGIHLEASSDSFINGCHVGGIVGTSAMTSSSPGTIGGCSYYIKTGNTRIGAGCKAAYANNYGFYLASGRGTITGIEAQDCGTGVMFDGSPYTANGLTVDTCRDAGIVVSTSQLNLQGFTILNRSTAGGGRYATQTAGLVFDVNTYTGLMLQGTVIPANITTPIVGTGGGYMRVLNGNSLGLTVG